MPVDDKLAPARDLLAFIDASPTPYHAVQSAVRRLEAAGFTRLDEREPLQVAPGSAGYLVRGGGSLLAFRAGTAPPSEAGFIVLGAHTDSPNLRLKPLAEHEKLGYRQLNVEVYGGVLLSTWLDRDLGVAGRVALSKGRTRLVHIDRPICRIPNLAIHLNREVNAQGLVVNAQEHLKPIWSFGSSKGAQGSGADGAFLELLLEELNAHEQPRALEQAKALKQLKAGQELSARDLLAFDLSLFDAQSSKLGGFSSEFLFAPRLDNLASCHAALEALLRGESATRATRVIVLHDHEEVGSQSAIGARSTLVQSTLARLAESYTRSQSDAGARAFARSLMISIDMAHAVHPNYADRHDPAHQPTLGAGPVIKSHASQAYATDDYGRAVFREACEEVGVLPQHFVSRSDLPCGTTIGPISAAQLGMRTIDVGNPMLAMHSCREVAASSDVLPMIAALGALLLRPEPLGLAD